MVSERLFTRVWVSTIVFMVLILICSFFATFDFSTGSGKQAGYVSEVERTGIFWRPPEVRLISIVPTYSGADTVWYFGASDEMAKKAEMFSKNNTQVIISYTKRMFVWNWEYSSNVLIDDIQPIENTAK
jgi:hypothetical protein